MMAKPITIALIALLSLLTPWLYDRAQVFYNIWDNRPSNFKSEHSFKSYEVKFRKELKNCEDVVLEEGMGVAIVSCSPGRDKWNTVMGVFEPYNASLADQHSGALYIYDYASSLPASTSLRRIKLLNFPNSTDLHPLGMDFDPSTSTLYLINHSRYSGSVIDIFQLSVRTATATHTRRFSHALLHAPNSIQPLGNGKLLVTNDHFVRAAVAAPLSKLETLSGVPGGTVVYTDIHRPQDTRVLARVGFANGIARLNASTVAVASSSKPGVYLYELGADHGLTLRKLIRAPASVDNVSVDSAGKLLMAGHPFAMGLMGLAETRRKCDEDGGAEEREACRCTVPSWTAEWSEEGGLKVLYKGRREGKNGEDGFCSSSTVVRDASRGVGIVSGLYERGLLVFKS